MCSFILGRRARVAQTLPCVSPQRSGGRRRLRQASSIFAIRRTESKFSGTAVLSYKPTDQLLTYVSYSRGYKAGGFNLDRSALAPSAADPPLSGNGAICVTTQPAAGASPPIQFKPETNRRVRGSAPSSTAAASTSTSRVFHQLFKNFQLNTFNGLNFVVENVNSCSDRPGRRRHRQQRADRRLRRPSRAGVQTRLRARSLHPPDAATSTINGGVTMANTKYRHNLVGDRRRPLTNALFQLPGRRISNSPQWTGDGSIAWTPPIGNSGLRALFYLDGRQTSRATTPARTSTSRSCRRASRCSTAASASTGPTTAGRSSSGARTCSTRTSSRSRSTRRSRAAARPAARSTTSAPPRLGPDARPQLYGAFLGEPRTFGVTLRGKLQPGRPRRRRPAASAAAAAAAGDADLPGRLGDRGDRACPAPPPPPPPPPPAPERGNSKAAEPRFGGAFFSG